MTTADAAFSISMLFGVGTCGYGIYYAISKDPYGNWLTHVPALAGFMFFPLVNCLLGLAVLYGLAADRRRAREMDANLAAWIYGIRQVDTLTKSKDGVYEPKDHD